ncbi:Der GTPase-activating protein YihI [Candidatus Sodalis endolongispinus]|uniref:Der GTPase-activating protein YihI n=1 Tax=Candidatus Sodalis endolongispinus TaxID=2812662 RepID=A0ABS5YAC8_9GAMM|nr:Der GTPase-activating protein YihI [Candidatus Sodalis endolongispinus]MBT9431949.1 Der GTPase-activating protein YihI [Candidatus Sodalis endolongispinus]
MNPSARGIRGKPGDARKKKQRKSREELNIEGRERKRQKKRRGLAAGSRSQGGGGETVRQTTRAPQDSRIGSKKPVALTVEGAVAPRKAPSGAPPLQKPQETAEQELAHLENDERLDGLLQRLEQDETLSTAEKRYVDQALDRIDELMTELGIELIDDEEQPAQQEDMLPLLKRGYDKDSF